MPGEERILFKDKITKKEYTVLAKELLNAIEMGEDALKKVLIGCENPELYSSPCGRPWRERAWGPPP